jgi:hypothetical protein
MSNRVFSWQGLSASFGRTLIAAICLCSPPILLAQSNDTDGGEVAAFAGGVFGLGTHGTVGGSAGAAISRYALALFEGSYTPLGSNTIQPWPEKSTVARSHLTDFDVCFHIRVPLKERWAPYGILGVGLLWNGLRQESLDSHGYQVSYHWNQFNAGFLTGAGVRYFVGENWGIRPEFKVIISKQTFTQVSMGVFYVVPSNWP